MTLKLYELYSLKSQFNQHNSFATDLQGGKHLGYVVSLFRLPLFMWFCWAYSSFVEAMVRHGQGSNPAWIIAFSGWSKIIPHVLQLTQVWNGYLRGCKPMSRWCETCIGQIHNSMIGEKYTGAFECEFCAKLFKNTRSSPCFIPCFCNVF